MILLIAVFVLISRFPSFDHQVDACPETCVCKGPDVLCGGRNVSTIPKLQTIPFSATKLNLQYNIIKDIQLNCDNVTHHPQLTRLHLDHNQLTSLPAYNQSYLLGFTGLQELSVTSNKINIIAENVFSGLHQLLRLYLSDNRIQTIADGAFRGVRQLQTLSLYNNRLSKVVATWFDKLYSLKYLYLHNNLISSFEPDTFLWSYTLLKLYLHNNRITSMPPLPIKDCNKKSNLTCRGTELFLQGNTMHCACGRPKHDRSILNMTLPFVTLCCVDVEMDCAIKHYLPFFLNYVEGPVCIKPSIEISPEKGGDVCKVNGEPEPVVYTSVGCLPQYQTRNNHTTVTHKMTVICEAENIFGKASQIYQSDNETYLCSNETRNYLNETNSVPKKTHPSPVWSMICLLSFSPLITLLVLVTYMYLCIRKDVSEETEVSDGYAQTL